MNKEQKECVETLAVMLVSLMIMMIVGVSIASYFDYGIKGPIITLTISSIFIGGSIWSVHKDLK